MIIFVELKYLSSLCMHLSENQNSGNDLSAEFALQTCLLYIDAYTAVACTPLKCMLAKS